MVNKQLQYTYCPISQPDNWSVYREINVTRKIFFFKNHAENEAGTLVPELFSFVK